MSGKYHAVRVKDDGHTFDSKAEHRRYRELLLLQKAGEITGIKIHPRYQLVVNGVKICMYVADYRYRVNGREVVEDVKGVRTPVYRLKKKLMLALHGIEITEVEA